MVVLQLHLSHKHVSCVFIELVGDESEKLAVPVGLVVVDAGRCGPFHLVGADGPVAVEPVSHDFAKRLLVTVDVNWVALYLKLRHFVAAEPLNACVRSACQGLVRLARASQQGLNLKTKVIH